MAKRKNVYKELLSFIIENKLYWIAPIAIIALLLIALIAFSAMTGGAAAPFIYTLF